MWLHRIIDAWYEAINEGNISCHVSLMFKNALIWSTTIYWLKGYLCMVYKAPNLLGLRINWKTANDSYPLMATYQMIKTGVH